MAMQLLFVPLFVALLWAALVGVRWGFGGVGRGRIRGAGGSGGGEEMGEGVKDAEGQDGGGVL